MSNAADSSIEKNQHITFKRKQPIHEPTLQQSMLVLTESDSKEIRSQISTIYVGMLKNWFLFGCCLFKIKNNELWRDGVRALNWNRTT